MRWWSPWPRSNLIKARPIPNSLPDRGFAEKAQALEAAYLRSEDPIVQSGFSGGRTRWASERSPLVDAIHRDGDFLDVGCANSQLLKDVVDWSRSRGFEITPHGVDLGVRLVGLAQIGIPAFSENFTVADAWSWEPERQWTFVYSLLDLSPPNLWCDWLHRLSSWVEPDGRLIVGSYGSRSREINPLDVVDVMESCGLTVIGSSHGGKPKVTAFAWSEGSQPPPTAP